MMKKTILLLLMLLPAAAGFSQKPETTLTVYTYDSMSWIEDRLTKSFEEKNGCKVNVVKFESTSKIISRLILEKRKPKADVAIGLTPSMLIQAKQNKVLAKYGSPALKSVKNRELIFDRDLYTTPFDYGAIAFIYNPAKISPEPKSFEDLLNHKNAVIIQDPRTSSTGTDFLFWTIAKYGNGWEKFWENFRGSVLTAAPGWSEAFSKFENGEAPVMVSYSTDGAYSMHNYGSSKYRAFIPDSEGFIQIEGVSVTAGAP